MPQKRKASTSSPRPASAKPPKPAKKRKGGRPLDSGFKPTQEQRDQVELMAACGIPHDDMVLVVPNPHSGKPIMAKTLRKLFRLELDRGIVKANVKVIGQMFKSATTPTPIHPNGNPILQIFWAKCRLRWQQDPTKRSVLFEETLPAPVPGQNPEQPALDPEKVNAYEYARRVAFVLEIGNRKKEPA